MSEDLRAKVTVPVQLLQAVVVYLQTKPFNEVADLIAAIRTQCTRLDGKPIKQDTAGQPIAKAVPKEQSDAAPQEKTVQ
jgi:hypothetical protein